MPNESLQTKRRVVAIVGQPNVGKSAIFNRLAKSRIAIVHEESGVTRDRLMCEVSWNGEQFELIDTGGVCNIDGALIRDETENGIRNQVDTALADAAVVVFVVDITVGVTPLDEEVARLLRKSGCFTIVAGNKADSLPRDVEALEFERFGFPAFPVSALHNRGFDPLMDQVVGALPDVENVTVADPLKIAVVGRPNVGKSSYVNKLLKSDRVIVSSVPGTTRDSVDIPFVVGQGPQARHYLLIDTAGMRRAGKVRSAIETFGRFRAEKSIAKSDVVVLILDAIQGPTTQDKKIGSLVLEHKKGCVILVNKWDLATGMSKREYGSALKSVMPFLRYCPVVFASAKTGFNIRQSVEAINHVALQVSVVLPTGLLNRTITEAYMRVASPKGLRIFYSTQVGTGPVRIRLFVNDPKRVQSGDKAYLVRKLREGFGLEGAPVVLEFRSRRSTRGASGRSIYRTNSFHKAQ